MPRLQGSGIIGAAAGLVVAIALTAECRAYPLGKHHAAPPVQPVQPVYLIPLYPVAQAAGYAPAATSAYPTYNAPVNPYYGNTGNAPAVGNAPAATGGQVMYFNGQSWSAGGGAGAGNAPTTGNAPMNGNAPTTCNIPPDEQMDIVEQIKDFKKDQPDSTRQDLNDKAYELVADSCGKTVDDLSADDKLVARRLVRLATQGSAPSGGQYPVVGGSSGGYGPYPNPYPYPYPYAGQGGWPTVFPVQLVAPATPPPPQKHWLHHLLCPCSWCRSHRGY
jgi:hypothetical protein